MCFFLFSCNHSQHYVCIKFLWRLDDNVQTYMELMDARELQEKLQKRSRKTKKTKPIDRTSEKHDLSVQPKYHHIRLKRKAKLTSEQRSDKSVNRRNRAVIIERWSSAMYLSTVQYTGVV